MASITSRRILIVAFLVGAVAVVAYLALFDPTVYPAPRCVFKLLTGLECPGCGSQRAIHALFGGHFGEAWGYNPAVFVALPLAALYAWPPRRLKPVLLSAPVLWGIVAAILLWWVFRNIF